jgi:3-methylcrotonyl-CoA carboxylase alpha subunit
MIKSILIANRGEIACRIIRTCRRLGIRSVAIHSDPDRDARHVSMADEAISIGGATATESYLNVAAVLEAAKKSGIDAIHPGYGFLSENADFAAACANANIIFIGPPPAAIRAMGSKSAAKALMETAKVPILPGYHGDAQDSTTLTNAADSVGYPILLKPSAGGGGRGMRLVEHPSELAISIDGAKREAMASFADDHLLIEKYLTATRHIEVQVFADRSGNIVHLFERDCSVQRRHQKIIEEAPAPSLTDDQRLKIANAAVEATRAVAYEGAGTVEFLLDHDGGFYFMEMNTRLQVEHPVTEMITGEDLVEWQILVASGQDLPKRQDQITMTGHAIEARLYAEDPAQDFIPSVGRINYLRLPDAGDGVRIDSGIREGDDVTPYYDPMIAKIIAHAPNREDALKKLQSTVSEIRVAGPAVNTNFLFKSLTHPEFVQGGVNTGFLDHQGEALTASEPDVAGFQMALGAISVSRHRALSAKTGADAFSPWRTARGWRTNQPPCETISLKDGHTRYDLIISGDQITFLGKTVHFEAHYGNDGDVAAVIGGMERIGAVFIHGHDVTVFSRGETTRLQLFDILEDAESHAGDFGDEIPLAPMPGVVVAVLVEPGATVTKGEALMVIEAMKVEHTIRAAIDGTIDTVYYQPGDTVDDRAQLIAFTAHED